MSVQQFCLPPPRRWLCLGISPNTDIFPIPIQLKNRNLAKDKVDWIVNNGTIASPLFPDSVMERGEKWQLQLSVPSSLREVNSTAEFDVGSGTVKLGEGACATAAKCRSKSDGEWCDPNSVEPIDSIQRAVAGAYVKIFECDGTFSQSFTSTLDCSPGCTDDMKYNTTVCFDQCNYEVCDWYDSPCKITVNPTLAPTITTTTTPTFSPTIVPTITTTTPTASSDSPTTSSVATPTPTIFLTTRSPSNAPSFFPTTFSPSTHPPTHVDFPSGTHSPTSSNLNVDNNDHDLLWLLLLMLLIPPFAVYYWKRRKRRNHREPNEDYDVEERQRPIPNSGGPQAEPMDHAPSPQSTVRVSLEKLRSDRAAMNEEYHRRINYDPDFKKLKDLATNEDALVYEFRKTMVDNLVPAGYDDVFQNEQRR